MTPADVKPGRYKPPDVLLAFLERCDYADNPNAEKIKKPADSERFAAAVNGR